MTWYKCIITAVLEVVCDEKRDCMLSTRICSWAKNYNNYYNSVKTSLKTDIRSRGKTEKNI